MGVLRSVWDAYARLVGIPAKWMENYIQGPKWYAVSSPTRLVRAPVC